jgi:hypothetical protein
MNAIVVARCNEEEVAWIKGLDEKGWLVFVESFYQPAGREAYAYLKWICAYYNDLQDDDEIVFVQGNPFDHCPNFLSDLAHPSIHYYGKLHSCNADGLPACTWTPLHAWAAVFKLPQLETYEFVAGAQYRVRGTQIKARPLVFWNALFNCVQLDNKGAWVSERLWSYIFKVAL